MKRREFVNFVGLGLIATSLPVAIAACASSDSAEEAAETPAVKVPTAEVPTATTPAEGASSARPDGFSTVGSVADLDAAGFLTSTTIAAAPVMVVRDAANPENVSAVNATCTHNGCPVKWASTEFVCDCHGSKFSAEGTVTNGPATVPLTPYEAKIEGDQVLVKAA
jgi:cytochrome b6-f complex iron-sulfur subunit